MIGPALEFGVRALVPAIAGLTCVIFGVAAVRRRGVAADAYADLGVPFGALAILFGGCGILYAGAVALGTVGTPLVDSISDRTMGFVVRIVLLPWTVFALRYVGRGELVTRRRVIAATGVIVTLAALEAVAILGPYGITDQQRELISVVASVIVLGVLAIVFAAAWLVLSTAGRHDRFTWWDGLLAVAPVAIPMLVFQTTRPSTQAFNRLLSSLGFGLVAVAIWLVTARYGLLAERPGTGRLGERAAVSEMDEPVFVVDRGGRIARSNPVAKTLFGRVDGETHLDDVTGFTTVTLDERETVECQTTDGRRRFDPRITDLRNGRDELLGRTLTLFDVTEREIRRQRLQVLNRILRHNLRNRLDVIRAHAEETENDPIIDNADQLDRLSTEARRLEALMQRADSTETEISLAGVVTDVTDGISDSYPAADVRVDVPNVTLEVDRDLCRYALEQLVENAVEHNDKETPNVEITGSTTDTGARLIVADDGPGIPDTEVNVIASGTESDLAHGSGLGLWGANWAIRTAGGSLAFESSRLGGAAVVVEVPGQP
ncbi:sensor histidine kinase [Halorubrum sp. BOL3-1]|uniref:ATP-binding protein n=1 Tax=Halorubrum sp. BOL3-1 TaxID=2497325 RepID=UPI001004E821|nr:ATP-binding protein [Halorubrum sp. BOL3-1]QAU14112.1 sensor histidine kinase [Halorubrum sp. BOL3-1]